MGSHTPSTLLITVKKPTLKKRALKLSCGKAKWMVEGKPSQASSMSNGKMTSDRLHGTLGWHLAEQVWPSPTYPPLSTASYWSTEALCSLCLWRWQRVELGVLLPTQSTVWARTQVPHMEGHSQTPCHSCVTCTAAVPHTTAPGCLEQETILISWLPWFTERERSGLCSITTKPSPWHTSLFSTSENW